MIDLPNSLRSLLFFLWLGLVAASSAATPLCKITESWTLLNERLHREGLSLGEKLKNKLNEDSTISAHARFQNNENIPSAVFAQQQIDEALGFAENIHPGLLGDESCAEFIEVATTRRVLDSNINFELLSSGYVKMAAGAVDAGVLGVDDFMALVFQKQRIRFQNHAGFKNGNNYIYTEASFLRDWTRIFDTPNGNGFRIAKAIFDDLGNGPNHGVVGNIHAAAVLKTRDGMVIEAIDPDRFDGSYREVDVLTENLMIQVGVSHNTIRDKIGRDVVNAEGAADLIIEMEAAHPGKLYKFMYMEGNPEDFDLAIGYLNYNLLAKGSTRVITRDDFIKGAWNE